MQRQEQQYVVTTDTDCNSEKVSWSLVPKKDLEWSQILYLSFLDGSGVTELHPYGDDYNLSNCEYEQGSNARVGVEIPTVSFVRYTEALPLISWRKCFNPFANDYNLSNYK